MYADVVKKECGDKYPIGSICSDCDPTTPNLADPKKECTARPGLGTEAFRPNNVCRPDDDVAMLFSILNTLPFVKENSNKSFAIY